MTLFASDIQKADAEARLYAEAGLPSHHQALEALSVSRGLRACAEHITGSNEPFQAAAQLYRQLLRRGGSGDYRVARVIQRHFPGVSVQAAGQPGVMRGLTVPSVRDILTAQFSR